MTHLGAASLGQVGLSVDITIPSDLFSTTELQGAMQKALGRVAEEAKDFWASEVGRSLVSSKRRTEYANSLSIEMGDEETISVVLDADPLLHAIEMGAPAYDLKPGFLRGAISRTIPITSTPTDIKFRRVKADSRGWIHPGFPGLKIHEEVIRQIENVLIPRAVQEAIEETL